MSERIQNDPPFCSVGVFTSYQIWRVELHGFEDGGSLPSSLSVCLIRASGKSMRIEANVRAEQSVRSAMMSLLIYETCLVYCPMAWPPWLLYPARFKTTRDRE